LRGFREGGTRGMGAHGYKGKHEEEKDDSNDMDLSHTASLRNENLLDDQTR
jgi:hypothetical protein